MLRVSGVSKAKIFKGKYEAKLEFPEEGERVETKKPSMGGGYGYFLECTIYCFASCTEGGIPKLLTPPPPPSHPLHGLSQSPEVEDTMCSKL